MAREPLDRRAPESDPDTSWLGVPAIYCDTFTTGILSENGMLRIVFGDYVSKSLFPFYRCSIMMPVSDVKVLIRHLTSRVAEIEKKQAEIEAKATPE